LIAAFKVFDPASLLGDYNPKLLAEQLDLPPHWEEARLVAAAKAVADKEGPALEDGMAYAVAKLMTDREIELLVSYVDSFGLLGEASRQDVVDAREKEFASALWPAYRRAFEASACRKLACPPAHIPGEPTPSGRWSPPAATPEGLAATERYFKATHMYQVPFPPVDDVMTEEIAFMMANPHVAEPLLKQVRDEAKERALAAVWQDYRSSMVRIYASTYSVAELDGMAARESDPAFKAVAEKMTRVTIGLAGATISAQKQMLAHVRARFCAEVACPPK
jgi:hypothetical protein